MRGINYSWKSRTSKSNEVGMSQDIFMDGKELGRRAQEFELVLRLQGHGTPRGQVLSYGLCFLVE